MSIAAPATNPASDLSLKLPATIGTAGQVVQNSSTAGTLEFGTPFGEKIAIANGTSVSSIVHEGIDFSYYRGLQFMGGVIPTTDNQEFNFYWRSGGTECTADTYFTGYNRLIPSDTADAEAEFNQGRLQLCGQTGNADDEGFYFNIFMFPFVSGDENNMGNFITWQGMHRDGSGNYRTVQGAGRYMTNVSPNGFSFMAHSGNIDHYNYSLYGIKR